VTPEPTAPAHLRHELRTPLNHIIGYTEILLEDAEDGRGGELLPALRCIRDDAGEILGVIDELLGPAAEEAGGVDLPRLRAALSAPLDRILAAGGPLEEQAARVGTARTVEDVARIVAAAGRLQALVMGVAPPASAQPVAAASPTPDAVRGELPTPPAGRGVILVVDDDGGNRGVLARWLAREGYEVREAADGEPALELLRTAGVDLVLLDVMMPGLDGYEVLRRLKADARLREVPVLMISALDEAGSVVRCIELGAEDYLPKPFEPVLLRARIGACLEKKRLRDQEARHHRELAEWNRTLERRVQEQVAELERLGRLKRFFSPQLAELIVGGGADDPLKPHRREVTVVMLDIRGFGKFMETAEPEEVMGVLGEYQAAMGKLVMEHGGTIERFAGDGIAVLFNDPVEVPNPAERAVRMAVAMRDRVKELGEGWRRRGYELSLGIGIDEGYATIGAIGFEGRWDYGAMGRVTSVASHLCSTAQGGQILVSARVTAAVEDLVEVQAVGALTFRGLAKPVPAFNVVALKREP